MQQTTEQRKRAIIIGAGPAGLTAAFELLTRTDILPVILEKSDYIGGISRTINYKGNRIDIGGHRFFSKSDRVMKWWLNIMPMQQIEGASAQITYQRQTTTVPAHPVAIDPEVDNSVMLVRNRKSRIYFMRQFFDYPITLSGDTLMKLGFWKTMKIGFSYMKALLFPIKPETNLEEFFINRFGRELYLTFFKSYTEKVWGIECNAISAEWGAQRIKGLSILKAVTHILKKMLPKKKDISQKDVETSLIEQFLYPKYGPGQMWEEVATLVLKLGGEIHMEWNVDQIKHNGSRILSVAAHSEKTKESKDFEGDYFFSTMPVKELVADMNPPAPARVREVSDGLVYRDFITVGVLCDKIKLREASGELVRDNWIYIQEPDVLVGRLQIFNNWSPSMVADPNHIWIGLEYFCNEGDALWTRSEAEMIQLAKDELASMNMLEKEDVLDATVIRVPKTYPAYFGSYDRFPEVISWVNGFDNLFLVGRNGMHKYNNQDHSMLTAMTAVDNIIADVRSRDNLWALNTEQEYHEEKDEAAKVASNQQTPATVSA